MLLFLCTFSERPLPAEGLQSAGEPFRLHRRLADARAACSGPDGTEGRVLVLDAPSVRLATADPPTAHHVPAAAVLNLEGGYRPPKPVAAAGGYVVRRGAAGVEVLLIFRRGAWDLPKGKLDKGERPEDGALREVSEEVGVPLDGLRLVGSLGSTLHGYPHPKRDSYAVKTTYWYAMTTTAEGFTPQAEEGIEAVAWVPWTEAGERLGFESLRRHHAGLEPGSLWGT